MGLPNIQDYVHKHRERLMEEKRLKLLAARTTQAANEMAEQQQNDLAQNDGEEDQGQANLGEVIVAQPDPEAADVYFMGEDEGVPLPNLQSMYQFPEMDHDFEEDEEGNQSADSFDEAFSDGSVASEIEEDIAYGQEPGQDNNWQLLREESFLNFSVL